MCEGTEPGHGVIELEDGKVSFFLMIQDLRVLAGMFTWTTLATYSSIAFNCGKLYLDLVYSGDVTTMRAIRAPLWGSVSYIQGSVLRKTPTVG